MFGHDIFPDARQVNARLALQLASQCAIDQREAAAIEKRPSQATCNGSGSCLLDSGVTVKARATRSRQRRRGEPLFNRLQPGHDLLGPRFAAEIFDDMRPCQFPLGLSFGGFCCTWRISSRRCFSEGFAQR